MPTIASFYGIIIMMYLLGKDHNPPHIHAFYGDDDASFTLSDGELYKGDFPNNGRKLVKEFILLHKDELIEMWNTGNYHKLPPLK